MRLHYYLSLVFWSLFFSQSLQAKDWLQTYGLATAKNNLLIETKTQHSWDSLMRVHPFGGNGTAIFSVEQRRHRSDKTADFYILLLLLLWLGAIRFTNPRYFRNLFHVFANLPAGNNMRKDQIEQDSLPDFLMNLFFCFSAGAYVYYAARLFVSKQAHTLPPFILLVIIISGILLIYAAKFLIIRLSGWAFKVAAITAQYNFNVFLVNKVLAVALLPFILLLAFGSPAWAPVVFVSSAVVCGLLLLNRYMRSWSLLGTFFQHSRFHFFLYLCASELLPLAVLIKLLARGLIDA
jgi:hypothetical protein